MQRYEVASLLRAGENVIEVTVANGWYLGRIGNKSNVYGDRRALLLRLDAGETVIATDESWQVTFDGCVRFADFYDGETIDLRERERTFLPVRIFCGNTPKLIDHIGTFVREVNILTPERKGNIYDFKQNFAGVVRLKVRAKAGTVIIVRHAEILMDGKLFHENYRSAKATLTLVCGEGVNEFCPTFTYMGFRYAEISSDRPVEILRVEGAVYSSDMARQGTFSCSNENINKLQRCIGVQEPKSVFTLKKRFTVLKSGRILLHATALGLYFAEVNGERVGDAYIAPGWTSYKKMLQVQEYDVTDLLREGENEIVFTVSEGWYCGPLTWEHKRNVFGAQTAICADIIADGKTVLSTDENWTARESHIRESGIYNGETVDYTAECKPLTPVVVSFDKNVLVPQISEPVRNTERIPVKKIIRTPKGELVYDFGQNIAGVVEVKTPENFDGTLILQHAEILVNGNFYTDNLRSAKATDTYTVKGSHTLSPEFTFHGFRYMKLTGAELPAENVTALVRHTDMKRTGHLRTDNKRFNRLMDNVVWGQRGNFVDVPTDCPQRDERLGWTGDFNAFCRTAAYNYDIRLFTKKWLADLRNDQKENGEIPFFAPDATGEHGTDAMWCDAITMVPWTMYEMYGDISFLADNFGAMKKFLAARDRNTENGLMAKGHEFGDWLALDREFLISDSPFGRTDEYYISNVFYVVSAKIVADTAALLGDKDAEKYKKKYDRLLNKVRREYITPNGRLAFDTVTAQTLALHFGIIREKDRAKLAAELNENVKKHGCRMVTGFIGTPYLLFALADNGYWETARHVLLNNGYPGWLYEVDMGATTVWERWDGIRPDYSLNPESMCSYNHYAYGSVMEFVYRRIAGIETKEAGFAKIQIAPHPVKGLPAMKAEYNSVRGKIVSEYKQKDGKITYVIEIPEVTEAEIVLPDEKSVLVKGGKYTFELDSEELYCEPYTPESTVLEVFENPKAVKAFNEVFGGIFTGTEIAWMKGEPKTLQFMAEFRDMEKKMKLSDFPAMLARANERFKELTTL